MNMTLADKPKYTIWVEQEFTLEDIRNILTEDYQYSIWVHKEFTPAKIGAEKPGYDILAHLKPVLSAITNQITQDPEAAPGVWFVQDPTLDIIAKKLVGNPEWLGQAKSRLTGLNEALREHGQYQAWQKQKLSKIAEQLVDDQNWLDQESRLVKIVKTCTEQVEYDKWLSKFKVSDILQASAIEEIRRRLEQWKSAIKIEGSIECAREIFKRNIFCGCQGRCKHRRRYIWLDTCCIDKSNSSEYAESMSLMGDWYANAAFCLVYLDARLNDEKCRHHELRQCIHPLCKTYIDRERAAREWTKEWRRFQNPLSDDTDGDTDQVNNGTDSISSFAGIEGKRPQWSERAWTLQELVLSKMTFYANSTWENLSRPVENLGSYYHLCPFLELYTKAQKARNTSIPEPNKFWVSETKNNPQKVEEYIKIRKLEVWSSNHAHVKAAWNLIIALGDLRFKLPKNLNKDNAVLSIENAVENAAKDAPYNGTCELIKLFESDICAYTSLQSRDYTGSDMTKEERTQVSRNVIDFLLKCLVAETTELVREDRKYISRFSYVDSLDGWQDGTVRRKFPAEKIMKLAQSRESTVEVDRAYSLMGICGVRFPTFNAEGLGKALTRLFDEIIISSNDVSVFNWSGCDYGSHIRGRSLYPSDLKAFIPQQQQLNDANKTLAKINQDRRKELKMTYDNLFDILCKTINAMKKKNSKDVPIEWIQGIIVFLRVAPMTVIQSQLLKIAKILKYVQDRGWDNLSAAIKPKSSLKHETPIASNTAPVVTSKYIKKNVEGVKALGSKFGKKFRCPRGPPSPQPPQTTIEDTADKKSPWDVLRSAVKDYIENITPKHHKREEDSDSGGESSDEEEEEEDGVGHNSEQQLLQFPLPDDIENMIVEIGEIKRKDKPPSWTDGGSMISPNPIIINNSGIEGVFDIQRIIVQMEDAEMQRLRRQIRLAASPYQKISGNCIISTGFAMIKIQFQCEAHILEKQLGVVEMVANKILKERKGERDDTDAEKKASQMIKFIEEPLLDAIAGAEGAKWFLCQLELGSTHALYCYRIPSSEINFDELAIPESTLDTIWRTYIKRKKQKLCDLLERYTDSKDFVSDAAATKNEAFKSGTQIIQQMTSKKGEAETDSGKEIDVRQLLDTSIDISLALSDSIASAALSKILEYHADKLEEKLSVEILKQTPNALRSAVQSLDESGDWLPAKFHSAETTHMF
ncbi:hypothetical protein F5884DRAFT_877793 [Xylogone sp. PMI_703]|nr:hypothetical protein F5884DRAFT_877793 [Xylogone sp. PMI_703]